MTHKQKYHNYLRSDKWSAIRTQVIKDRESCEKCWGNERLEVHHKTYANVFKEQMEDLQLLCRRCHQEAHGIVDIKKLSLFDKIMAFLFG